jgi:imidazolonepropionase-like amidohydrolase
MTTLIRCGRLFDGVAEDIRSNVVIEIEGSLIRSIRPQDETNISAASDVIDMSDHFVMPGLLDIHTHLAYGNAKTEEDIDIYAPIEFRTLRGLFFAQRVLASGVTSLCAPGDAGQVSSSIRDAIDANLFDGPNVTAAGPYITSRQGLTDWYPTWIGVPSTSIGRLVKSMDEAIEEIRRQTKDGVDIIKIAMDGIQRRPDGEYIAAFNEDQTKQMATEIRRMGKRSFVHARGREATLYSAKAGVDLIFHASYLDDECIDWIVRNKCAVSPTFTLLVNTIEYMQPSDPIWHKSRKPAYEAELEAAYESTRRLRKAGVALPTGTDSGFAVTPYGEWHARELEIYVKHCGFTNIQALQSATSVAATMLRPKDKVGRLAPGFHADVIAINGDPVADISHIVDRKRLSMVMKNGKIFSYQHRDYEPRRVSDFAMASWNDLYTQDRVADLRSKGAIK